MWLRLVTSDENAVKSEPLHVHHVVFQSLGGSHAAKNLIPLCPTCHTMLHDERRAGGELISDEELRGLWTLWKFLGLVVPKLDFIGPHGPCFRVRVAMNIYGLTSAFDISTAISYEEARAGILVRTVGVLSSNDPHFPFARGQVEPTQWELSCDRFARPGHWLEQPAGDVIGRSAQPLSFRAPLVIALSEGVSWVFSTRPQHRVL